MTQVQVQKVNELSKSHRDKVGLDIIKLERDRNISQWKPVIVICCRFVIVCAGFDGVKMNLANIRDRN